MGASRHMLKWYGLTVKTPPSLQCTYILAAFLSKRNVGLDRKEGLYDG